MISSQRQLRQLSVLKLEDETRQLLSELGSLDGDTGEASPHDELDDEAYDSSNYQHRKLRCSKRAAAKAMAREGGRCDECPGLRFSGYLPPGMEVIMGRRGYLKMVDKCCKAMDEATRGTTTRSAHKKKRGNSRIEKSIGIDRVIAAG